MNQIIHVQSLGEQTSCLVRLEHGHTFLQVFIGSKRITNHIKKS